MQELATVSANSPQASSTEIDERRRAINALLVAVYAGTSHEAPTGDAMRVAVSVWMAALDKAAVPSSALIDLLGRELAERTNSFPPSVTDIARQWRLLQAERPNKTIQQEDAERLNALPEGKDGPGRLAWIALGKRGTPVMCDCEPSCAAVIPCDPLTKKIGDHWQCASGACGFSWPVSDTVNAPAKGKHGPLFDEVRATSTEAEKAAKAIRKTAGGNHSPFLLKFSDDCGVVLDACTPAQYVEFRQFAHWFKASYPGCKITPSLLAEEYPRFQAQTAAEVAYI